MTAPPTVCPCGPANDMANLLAKGVSTADGGDDDGSTVLEIDSNSKQPWKVIVVVGCRKETLETVPHPDNTHRPVSRWLQNRVTAATISSPLGTSRTYGDIEESGSWVMTTGGFGLGLFLDPGGRPLGRRTTSIDAPSLLVLNSFLKSASSEVVVRWWETAKRGGGHGGWWRRLEKMVGRDG